MQPHGLIKLEAYQRVEAPVGLRDPRLRHRPPARHVRSEQIHTTEDVREEWTAGPAGGGQEMRTGFTTSAMPTSNVKQTNTAATT